MHFAKGPVTHFADEHAQGTKLVGLKYDDKKARFDLIPPRALYDLADVYTYGAGKYSDRNWEAGIGWGRVFAALMRHLWRWWGGEDLDEESGLPHLAHAAWGCITLLEYRRSHVELDDRPTSSNPVNQIL